MKRVIVFLLLLSAVNSFSNTIKGKVFGNENTVKVVLPGATIHWAGTSKGTMADENGLFMIQADPSSKSLIFSFVGYRSDTIQWNGTDSLEVVLEKNEELDEVTVYQKNKGTHISKINPIYTEHINGAELQKAACCNLSESFLTNPSVDVSYSDAMTGAKQIKLLGLDGTYSQLQTENFPNLRGLATSYGLTYIPGPWLESIQVSKGTASVVNGYESITGQINANFKKPDANEIFHFNVFASNEGKTELNSNFSVKLSEKTSTAFFVHGENFQNRVDHNMDGFLDEPIMKQIHLFNQWKYTSANGFMLHSGVHYLKENRMSGQSSFRKDMERNTSNPYGVNIDNERFEGYFKGGYEFPNGSHALAFISNFTYHKMGSFYGLNDYSGNEITLYGNLVHTFFLGGHDKHMLNSGLSLIVDQADEILNQNSIKTNESVPGVFSEYTFKPSLKFTLMAGLRADFHNTFCTFITPRFHMKYNPADQTTFRISGGKGYRTPRILAENSFLLANARSLNVVEENIMEEAWNYGMSINQEIYLTDRPLIINAEYYRTNFINQLIVDRESSASEIILAPLDGESYANSYQLEFRYEVLPRLDITTAYRINDVKQTINNQLVRKPLTSKYKGLVTMNYTDRLKKWMFDYTVQFNGGGRLHIIAGNENNSPLEFTSYTVMNAQITKYFRYWNIYLGSENLLDYTQDHPVIGAENPFGNDFDATRIWGPVMGRKFYAGIRITLNNK